MAWDTLSRRSEESGFGEMPVGMRASILRQASCSLALLLLVAAPGSGSWLNLPERDMLFVALRTLAAGRGL